MATDPTETNPFLRKVIDVYNGHRVDDFDTIFTEDCVLVRNGIEAIGRDAVKRVVSKLYRAFPDISYHIEDAVIAGDKIAIRWEGHGTHRGDYLGFEPTGREVSYAGITLYELRGDKIAKLWVTADLLGLARSLRPSAPVAERPEARH